MAGFSKGWQHTELLSRTLSKVATVGKHIEDERMTCVHGCLNDVIQEERNVS